MGYNKIIDYPRQKLRFEKFEVLIALFRKTKQAENNVYWKIVINRSFLGRTLGNIFRYFIPNKFQPAQISRDEKSLTHAILIMIKLHWRACVYVVINQLQSSIFHSKPGQ